MFSTQKPLKVYEQGIYEYGVSHIDGIILNEDSMKPSDNNIIESAEYKKRIEDAQLYLEKQFREKDLFFTDTKTGSYVLMKEKFGDLRIECFTKNEKDKDTFRNVLIDTLEKYPEFAPYLRVHPCDETILFVGTKNKFDAWRENLEPNGLEKTLHQVMQSPWYTR